MIPALGHQFNLGMRSSLKHINFRRNSMVTWANERNCSKTSRTDEVFTENSNIDKTNVLDMDAKIDMVNFKGAAKYFNDVKTSNSQFGDFLKNETTTAIKQLNFEHWGNGKLSTLRYLTLILLLMSLVKYCADSKHLLYFTRKFKKMSLWET